MSDPMQRMERMYEEYLQQKDAHIEELEKMHTHLLNTIAHLPTFNAVAKNREVAAIQALKDYWLEVAAKVCESEGMRTDASWWGCAVAIRNMKDE